MFFVAVLVVCYSIEHCELRMPPGDDLTWMTVEECSDYGERLEADAREKLGEKAAHVSWWCIPVADDLGPEEATDPPSAANSTGWPR